MALNQRQLIDWDSNMLNQPLKASGIGLRMQIVE
jgi:hypothetical protein